MSSISSVTSNSDPYQSTVQPNAKQIKSDFKALASALQSGSLSDAQQAIATLKKDAPDLFNSNTNSSQNSTQSNPLATLATALQSGDLTSAQTAFAALQQQQQQQKVGGHHHHHHRGSTQASTAEASATPTVSPTGTTGTQINATA